MTITIKKNPRKKITCLYEENNIYLKFVLFTLIYNDAYVILKINDTMYIYKYKARSSIS